MRKNTIHALWLFLLVAGGHSLFAQTNFSGSWKWEAGKSDRKGQAGRLPT